MLDPRSGEGGDISSIKTRPAPCTTLNIIGDCSRTGKGTRTSWPRVGGFESDADLISSRRLFLSALRIFHHFTQWIVWFRY
jgi:hypothetical protein